MTDPNFHTLVNGLREHGFTRFLLIAEAPAADGQTRVLTRAEGMTKDQAVLSLEDLARELLDERALDPESPLPKVLLTSRGSIG